MQPVEQLTCCMFLATEFTVQGDKLSKAAVVKRLLYDAAHDLARTSQLQIIMDEWQLLSAKVGIEYGGAQQTCQPGVRRA